MVWVWEQDDGCVVKGEDSVKSVKLGLDKQQTRKRPNDIVRYITKITGHGH